MGSVVKLNPGILSRQTVELAQLVCRAAKLNPTGTVELAKEARELAPAECKTHALLGILAYQIGNYDWAYNLLQESARRLPDDAEAQTLLRVGGLYSRESPRSPRRDGKCGEGRARYAAERQHEVIPFAHVVGSGAGRSLPP